jgi:exonuclease VII small subunit
MPLEDELWLLQQKFRDLKEYRIEIRAVWDDSAAHELNSRYLNPHEADAEDMQNAMINQYDALEQTNSRLEMTSALLRKAENLSQQVAQRLASADETLIDVHKQLDLSVNYRSEAESGIPEVHRIIAIANSACRGIPSS